jgi:hypothetical protein
MGVHRYLWRQLKDFSGYGGGATYLLPRWILLRCVGAVFIIAFAGIIDEGKALIGPRGICPVADFCTALLRVFPNPAERLLRAPSLFWISSGPGMIAFLEWGGLVAAAALVLNLWPRMALFCCWAFFLSFVSTWQLFTSSIDDQLMLETGLLCIALAPSGLRPGLGAASPPLPIAVLAVRWLLFRIMLESGLCKILLGETHWRDFSVMKVLYETSPSPTILGYYDHMMPQAYHAFEIALTFAAELAAPVLAVFGGRRGRWVAIGLWTVFQAGIQLTLNFGWLNTAALALGVVFLDDQMLAAAAARVRPARRAGAPTPAAAPARPLAAWRVRMLSALVAAQFAVAAYTFIRSVTGTTEHGIPRGASRSVEFLFMNFKSANAYIPFAGFAPAKEEVEFTGSNDGGATWRTYDFRFKPQSESRISPFVAPWFPRFEAALQLAVFFRSPPIIPTVARLLVQRNPEVTGLFAKDPFPDAPPTIIRMPVYRFAFTDLETHRRTGRFWIKTYVGDYAPPARLEPNGQGAGGR